MLVQPGCQQQGAASAANSVADAPQQSANLRAGWTTHCTQDSRLYYCNHLTHTSTWLPPVESWISHLPFGWEEAADNDGKPYYINHLNKTTTYEDPRKDWDEEPPMPREVTLTRHPELGFGFVAGSEKPVIVRFVIEGGPSVDLLLPGDQILSINGEDVKKAPRDHVIKLVRACKDVVHLTVCQPPLVNSTKKSALLSASKKAKLKSNPCRVRFAEGIIVNGSPLFPQSTFTLNDGPNPPVLPNVLKVYLENGQTKSFKYDSSTTVRDVLTSLLQKLCIRAEVHFSLVVEHFKSLRRNKLTLLDPNEVVARIAARPGSHNLRCLFRVSFVPKDAAELAQADLAAFEYLYMQCCNDVVQERYAPELKYDMALRLAALHIHQHALAHNLAGKVTVKAVEREFGLERFVPVSLMSSMKRKELRKLLSHFLKLNQFILPGQKSLTSFQAKLHYLNIVSELPSYGAKCFSTNLRDANMETVLLVSPKFGISQILGIRNSVPVALADIEEIRAIVVRREDELSKVVQIFFHHRSMFFSLEDRDAEELVLVLQGYYRLLTADDNLIIEREEPDDENEEDSAPPYLGPHHVRPANWSYATVDTHPRLVNFSLFPPYKPPNLVNGVAKLANGGVDGNMNSLENKDCGIDFQSVVSMELLQTDNPYLSSRNEEALKRVAEMQELVLTSEQYLTEQQNGLKSTPYPLRHPILKGLTEESDMLPLGQLKHSDSLTLLNQQSTDNLEEIMRKLEVDPSESDTDSSSTPASSPMRHRNRGNTGSFGLHSPDGLGNEAINIQEYLRLLRMGNGVPVELGAGSLYLDPDLIDLTEIPPPATPDDDIGFLPSQPSLPPTLFADIEQTIDWTEEEPDSGRPAGSNADDLEAFLATVVVAPPAPAEEITPEEILSYIIPPPPDSSPVVTPFKRRNSYDSAPATTVRTNGFTTFSPHVTRKKLSNNYQVSGLIPNGVGRSHCFKCSGGGAGFGSLPRTTSDAHHGHVVCGRNELPNGRTAKTVFSCKTKEELISRCEAALAVLLVRLDQLATQCDQAQTQGGGEKINEEKFLLTKQRLLDEAIELVPAAKHLVQRLTTPTSTLNELAEVCGSCLQRMRRINELAADLASFTTSPLQTRSVILRVHDVTKAVKEVIRLPNGETSERLAAVLGGLLRSLKVFE